MDAVWCLAPPPPSLADALHFTTSMCMSSDSASASSSSPTTLSHHHAWPPLLADLAPPPLSLAPRPRDRHDVDSVSAVPTPRGSGRRHQQLGPAGGRSGKRRSRASKRAPTTYITTDPANFRLMVQNITGVQADPAATGDIDVLLAAGDTANAAGGCYGNPLLPTGDEASAALLHQQHQQLQPCFPTLDSWNVSMYDLL